MWRGPSTPRHYLLIRGNRVGLPGLLPGLSIPKDSGPTPPGSLKPSSPKLSVPTLTGPIAQAAPYRSFIPSRMLGLGHRAWVCPQPYLQQWPPGAEMAIAPCCLRQMLPLGHILEGPPLLMWVSPGISISLRPSVVLAPSAPPPA